MYFNAHGFQIGNAMEKINSILTRKKCSAWLETPCISVFGCAIPMAQVLRLYIQMFLSYGLYLSTILETAPHHTFGIICNITQNTTSEENSYKMFHIPSLIVLFLMGRSRTFWGDKDQISSGDGKRKG